MVFSWFSLVGVIVMIASMFLKGKLRQAFYTIGLTGTIFGILGMGFTLLNFNLTLAVTFSFLLSLIIGGISYSELFKTSPITSKMVTPEINPLIGRKVKVVEWNRGRGKVEVVVDGVKKGLPAMAVADYEEGTLVRVRNEVDGVLYVEELTVRTK